MLLLIYNNIVPNPRFISTIVIVILFYFIAFKRFEFNISAKFR